MCCPSRPSWLALRTQMTLSSPMKPSWLTVHILFLSLVLTNRVLIPGLPWNILSPFCLVWCIHYFCLALLPYTNGWYFWVMVELNSICLYPPILSRVSSYTYRHTHSQKPSHYLNQQLSDCEQILTEGNINIIYIYIHIYIYIVLCKKKHFHMICTSIFMTTGEEDMFYLSFFKKRFWF